MLRGPFFKKLKQLLDHPPFVVFEDFKIESKESGSNTSVSITYQCGNGEFLNIVIPHELRDVSEREFTKNLQYVISLDFCPGELTRHGKRTVYGGDKVLELAKLWVERLVEDLVDEPIYRSLAQQEERLKSVEDYVAAVTEEYADAGQVERVREWLEEVESELRASVDGLMEDGKAKDERIAELEREFEILKKRIKTTPLRNVMRSVASRVLRLSADPDLPKVLKNGKKVAGLLMGGEHGAE